MKKAVMTVLVAVMLAAGMVKAQDIGMLIFNHQIAIGMTFGNVQAAWGNPREVNRSVTQYGVTEYWWYLQGGNTVLVTFFNGRVEYIGQ